MEKGDLRLDCDSRRLFISGREVNLTAKEFDLLELLVKNENKVYSRENLLGLVWGKDYPGDVRTVDVHVRRLREKIETNPSEPKYVHTKWGVGIIITRNRREGRKVFPCRRVNSSSVLKKFKVSADSFDRCDRDRTESDSFGSSFKILRKACRFYPGK